MGCCLVLTSAMILKVSEGLNILQEIPTATSPPLGVNFICGEHKRLISISVTNTNTCTSSYSIGDEVSHHLIDSAHVHL